MGKLIGFLIGFLFIPRFGLYAAFFGFLIGALFDLRYKYFPSFFHSENFIDNIFADVFAVFTAALTKAGGLERRTVLSVKNTAVRIFPRSTASKAMAHFKELVENGLPQGLLEESCDKVLYNFDYQSKLYILTLLSSIINAKETPGVNEIRTLEYIAFSIGIYTEDFKSFFNSQKNRNDYSNFNRSSVHEADPYSILELSRDSTEEEIKKKYRVLCKKYHPDLTGNLSENKRKEAEIKMKEIINAYGKIKKERGII